MPKAGKSQQKSSRSLKRFASPQTATTQEQIASEKLNYLVNFDSLTSLPNRSFFRQLFARSLRNAQRESNVLALVFLSLNSYKGINETLGPAIGDRLVRRAAKRLNTLIQDKGVVGYWGGDEFVLLLEHAADAAEASAIVKKIQEKLERRFVADSHEFYLTSSAGIGLYPSHGQNAETILRNAAAALFHAKQFGGSVQRLYSADMNAQALRRLTFEHRLRRALQRREFTIHYQPQVDSKNWKIIAAEALVRWDHPELGPIPPVDFIPLAEESGLIVPIDEWVLRTACSQLKHWHDKGFSSLQLAVNISARHFHEQDPFHMIVRTLAETRLDPRHLVLELTESAIMANAPDVIKSLSKLKEIGVRLSVDDFGTGFSSLDHLRWLPLDTLKIDKSFVSNSSANLDDEALVSSIITLAHRLRLKVTAEGIETAEQLRFLHQLGCDSMQGYLFSRPLPAEQFTLLLARANYRFPCRAADRMDMFSTPEVWGVTLAGRDSTPNRRKLYKH